MFIIEKLLRLELAAKNGGTKVSAQWSNDEVVHQSLVGLFNGGSSETTTELLKKVHHFSDVVLITGGY